jgi:hypothetical protein
MVMHVPSKLNVATIRPYCGASRDAARQELLRTTSINRAT